MVLIQRQHDKVAQHLTNTIRFGEITTGQTVQYSGSRPCPDMVVTEGDCVTIINVCCPFDNGTEALTDAEQRKIKYEHLQQHFSSLGKSCDIFGFVIGARSMCGTPAMRKYSNAWASAGRIKICLESCVV